MSNIEQKTFFPKVVTFFIGAIKVVHWKGKCSLLFLIEVLPLLQKLCKKEDLEWDYIDDGLVKALSLQRKEGVETKTVTQ